MGKEMWHTVLRQGYTDLTLVVCLQERGKSSQTGRTVAIWRLNFVPNSGFWELLDRFRDQ